MTPAMNRRYETAGSIRQPIHAGGGAGVALQTTCARPVQISSRTAEQFKLATVTDMWETYAPYNSAVKIGMILSVEGKLYTINQVGAYKSGRFNIMQLVLEARP